MAGVHYSTNFASISRVGGIIKKDANFHMTHVVNSINYLVYISNFEFVWGPGDEFHPNAYATAILLLHYLHTSIYFCSFL